MSAYATKRTCKSADECPALKGITRYDADMTRCLLMTQSGHGQQTNTSDRPRSLLGSEAAPAAISYRGFCGPAWASSIWGDPHGHMAVIVTLVIGAIAGWLAGVLVEGAASAPYSTCCRHCGAFIAALLFPRLGLGLTLGGGIVGAIVTSALGAIVLLLIVNLVQRLVS